MAVSDLYRDYRLSWFGNEGEAGDVVLASRVRLARNFARLPFPNRADRQQLAGLQINPGGHAAAVHIIHHFPVAASQP